MQSYKFGGDWTKFYPLGGTVGLDCCAPKLPRRLLRLSSIAVPNFIKSDIKSVLWAGIDSHSETKIIVLLLTVTTNNNKKIQLV